MTVPMITSGQLFQNLKSLGFVETGNGNSANGAGSFIREACDTVLLYRRSFNRTAVSSADLL